MNDSLPKISILYLKETFQMITNEPLMNQCHARRAMDGLQASRDPDLSRINYGHKLPITATVSNIVRWIGVLGTPHTIIALCSGGRTLFVRGLSRWCHLVIAEPRKTWLGVMRSDPVILEQSRINYGHKLPITATNHYEGFLAQNKSSVPKRNISNDHQWASGEPVSC